MESKVGLYYGKKLNLYKWICVCGENKWLPQYVVRAIKFCSVKCAGNNKKIERAELSCAACLKSFSRLKSKCLSKSGLYFCTKKCLDESKMIGGIEGVLPSHYGKARRREYSKSYKKQLKLNKCLTCNEPVYLNYCNTKCQTQHSYLKYIERWLQGLENGHNKGSLRNNVSPHVRKFMFEKNNNQCQECGWSKISKFTNKIPLQVDHVNGDSTNSSFENLRLLCPNCHTLTEFYGSLNKGRGRKHKLEYYHDNKRKYLDKTKEDEL